MKQIKQTQKVFDGMEQEQQGEENICNINNLDPLKIKIHNNHGEETDTFEYKEPMNEVKIFDKQQMQQTKQQRKAGERKYVGQQQQVQQSDSDETNCDEEQVEEENGTLIETRIVQFLLNLVKEDSNGENGK